MSGLANDAGSRQSRAARTPSDSTPAGSSTSSVASGAASMRPRQRRRRAGRICEDVLVSLTAEVALDYIDVRSLQRRLELARGNVSLQEETLELTRFRLQAGSGHRSRCAAGNVERRDYTSADRLARECSSRRRRTAWRFCSARRRERSTRNWPLRLRFPWHRWLPLSAFPPKRFVADPTCEAPSGSLRHSSRRSTSRARTCTPRSDWPARSDSNRSRWRGCSSRALPRSGARAPTSARACSIASSCARTS